MPASDQAAAFEALLRQVHRLTGAAAKGYLRQLRRMWSRTEDHEAMLKALVQQIRELREKRAAECNEADEDPGPN